MRHTAAALAALLALTPLALADSPKPVSAEATRFFWEAGRKAKGEFADAYGKIRFPALRPGKVASLARAAAEQLRELDKEGVDTDVIDHVNNVIRYYENLATNASKQGNKEAVQMALKSYTDYLREGGDAPPPPVPADLGLSVLKLLNDNEPAKAVQRLQADEANLLKTLRKRYDIELNPW